MNKIEILLKNLKIIRQFRGFTCAGLGRKIGLCRATVANIERGKQNLFVHQLILMADALEVDIEMFFNPIDLTVVEKTGICLKHGKVMLHSGLCHDCRKEIDRIEKLIKPDTGIFNLERKLGKIVKENI